MTSASSRAVRYTQFSPRLVRNDTPIELRGHRLKVYRVVDQAVLFDESHFTDLPRLLLSALPGEGSQEAGQPGVGFVIQNQSVASDYIVLAWWDRENELPMRVWVRDAGQWRGARGGESVCVYELEVIWYERNLWLETALSGRPLGPALEEYMSRHFRSLSRDVYNRIHR